MQQDRLKLNLEHTPSRVIRGGSWGGYPRGARVANRGNGDPGLRNVNLGFRLVRDNNHEGEHHEKKG